MLRMDEVHVVRYKVLAEGQSICRVAREFFGVRPLFLIFLRLINTFCNDADGREMQSQQIPYFFKRVSYELVWLGKFAHCGSHHQRCPRTDLPG